jgi:hypothetical protein
MNSHDLAKVLLENPDYPIVVDVYDHTYDSRLNMFSHGTMEVAVVKRQGDNGTRYLRIYIGLPGINRVYSENEIVFKEEKNKTAGLKNYKRGYPVETDFLE